MRESQKLAKEFGVSESCIYTLARALGRFPTRADFENRRKVGRPNSWNKRKPIEPMEAEQEQEEQE